MFICFGNNILAALWTAVTTQRSKAIAAVGDTLANRFIFIHIIELCTQVLIPDP